MFKEYNFSYFIDSAVNFKDSCLIRLVTNIVDVVLENFSKISVLSFLKNVLVGLEQEEIEDFEDYLIKYNINDFFALKSNSIETCKFYENFNKIRNHY